MNNFYKNNFIFCLDWEKRIEEEVMRFYIDAIK